VRGGWRKLHGAGRHILYSSRSVIRMIKSRRKRWVAQAVRMREKRNAWVGSPQGKRPLERTMYKWVDNRKRFLER
jgi:hypothetical protein